MSLVGPRPERPSFVNEFRETIPGYDLRHAVPGGMTGWAQVHGWRGPTSLRKRVQYDLDYIERWSLSTGHADLAHDRSTRIVGQDLVERIEAASKDHGVTAPTAPVDRASTRPICSVVIPIVQWPRAVGALPREHRTAPAP